MTAQLWHCNTSIANPFNLYLSCCCFLRQYFVIHSPSLHFRTQCHESGVTETGKITSSVHLLEIIKYHIALILFSHSVGYTTAPKKRFHDTPTYARRNIYLRAVLAASQMGTASLNYESCGRFMALRWSISCFTTAPPILQRLAVKTNTARATMSQFQLVSIYCRTSIDRLSGCGETLHCT